MDSSYVQALVNPCRFPVSYPHNLPWAYVVFSSVQQDRMLWASFHTVQQLLLFSPFGRTACIQIHKYFPSFTYRNLYSWTHSTFVRWLGLGKYDPGDNEKIR